MTIKNLLQFIFLNLCLSAICLGQNSLDSKESASLEQKHIKFDIALKEKEVKVGEMIKLNTLIQNKFTDNIDIRYNRYDDLAFYLVEITNSKGDILKRKDISNTPGVGSWNGLFLVPNEQHNFSLELNRFFDLPIGEYKINASLIALNADIEQLKLRKLEKITVKSNTIYLKIVK